MDHFFSHSPKPKAVFHHICECQIPCKVQNTVIISVKLTYLESQLLYCYNIYCIFWDSSVGSDLIFFLQGLACVLDFTFFN